MSEPNLEKLVAVWNENPQANAPHYLTMTLRDHFAMEFLKISLEQHGRAGTVVDADVEALKAYTLADAFMRYRKKT